MLLFQKSLVQLYSPYQTNFSKIFWNHPNTPLLKYALLSKIVIFQQISLTGLALLNKVVGISYLYRFISMKGIQKIILLFSLLLSLTDSCHPQCGYCVEDLNVCIACKGNYELILVDGSCHENTIQNCQIYGGIDECVKCRPTYTLINGKCVKTYDGCISSGDDSVCYQCGYNTLLQGDKCKGVINCRIFSEICEQCRENYQLINNVCVDISAGCRETNPLNGICTKCKEGYQISGYQCIQKQKLNPRCYVHQNNTSCYICKDGHREQQGLCLLPSENYAQAAAITQTLLGTGQTTSTNTNNVMITMERCEVPDAQGQGCLRCAYGYYPQPGGCQQVSQYCDGYNIQTGQCFACKFGLTLQQGQCYDINCKSLLSGGGCIQCNAGFKVNNNRVCENFDINCLTSINGRCQQCNTGFYTDISGMCKQLPANCAFANIQNGQCLECIAGFKMIAPGSPCIQQIVIQNCQVPNPQKPSECLVCIYGYYPSGSQCKKVSSMCKQHNVQDGSCTSCISANHQLINGKCIDTACIQLIGTGGEGCLQCAPGFSYDSTELVCKFSDANCKNIGPKQCLECKDGYYVGSLGKCNALPANCLAAQPTGACYSCRTGYQLLNGACQYFQQTANTTNTSSNTNTANNQQNSTQQITDPNCLSYNGNFCTKCSSRYYVYGDGKCVPVNPLCDGYNLRGECTSCYKGYQVNAGKCVIESSKDPNCKTFTGNACVQCYSGFFYSQQDRNCKRLNPLCKTSNLMNGYCLSCYQGYSLNPNTGSCDVFFKDPNCINFNGNLCLQCSKGFYLGNDGKCTQVNPLCKTSNQTNGACLTCFPGYTLSGKDCVLGADKDPNCKTFSGDNCVECFNSYFLYTGTKKCTKVDPLCKTFNSNNGNCLSCYSGYQIQGGHCELTTKDPNCKTFNGNQCVECFEGYLVSGGKCSQQNILCKQINKINGRCTSCWQGYTLSDGDCLLIQSTNPTGQQEDLYCINYSNGQCTKCSNGFYLSASTKKCEQVDPLCKESNPNNGACTSCYLGYSLSGRACIATVTASTIPNCVNFTAAGLCLECLDGYYVSNNSCAPVSILCSQYNKVTGQCLSCIPGYFFQDNSCIYPAIQDPYCVRYSGAYCDTCRNGYYLSSYICKQIHAQCAAFDYTHLVCLTCLNNYTPKGAECV